MALISCPECGTEVSDKAGACPKCGCPISRSSPSQPVAQDAVASVATDKARVTIRKDLLRLLYFGGVAILVAPVFAIFDLSFVGLLVGLFILFIGISRKFTCQYCGHRAGTKLNSLNATCQKCKTLHIIEWV